MASQIISPLTAITTAKPATNAAGTGWKRSEANDMGFSYPPGPTKTDAWVATSRPSASTTKKATAVDPARACAAGTVTSTRKRRHHVRSHRQPGRDRVVRRSGDDRDRRTRQVVHADLESPLLLQLVRDLDGVARCGCRHSTGARNSGCGRAEPTTRPPTGRRRPRPSRPPRQQDGRRRAPCAGEADAMPAPPPAGCVPPGGPACPTGSGQPAARPLP